MRVEIANGRIGESCERRGGGARETTRARPEAQGTRRRGGGGAGQGRRAPAAIGRDDDDGRRRGPSGTGAGSWPGALAGCQPETGAASGAGRASARLQRPPWSSQGAVRECLTGRGPAQGARRAGALQPPRAASLPFSSRRALWRQTLLLCRRWPGPAGTRRDRDSRTGKSEPRGLPEAERRVPRAREAARGRGAVGAAATARPSTRSGRTGRGAVPMRCGYHPVARVRPRATASEVSAADRPPPRSAASAGVRAHCRPCRAAGRGGLSRERPRSPIKGGGRAVGLPVVRPLRAPCVVLAVGSAVPVRVRAL